MHAVVYTGAKERYKRCCANDKDESWRFILQMETSNTKKCIHMCIKCTESNEHTNKQNKRIHLQQAVQRKELSYTTLGSTHFYSHNQQQQMEINSKRDR